MKNALISVAHSLKCKSNSQLHKLVEFKLAGERLNHNGTLRGGFLKSAWKC